MQTPNTKQSRARWSQDDYRLVAEYLKRHREIDCTSSTLVGITSQDIKIAQELVLPINKHRRGIIPMDRIREKLKLHLELLRDHSMEEAKGLEPAPEPEIVLQAPVSEAKNIMEKIFPQTGSPDAAMQHLIDATMTTFIDLLADRLVERILDKLPSAVVQSMAAPHRKHDPQPNYTTRPQRPTIVVLGLKPEQGEMLEKEFPMFKITCPKDKSPNLRDMLKQCDRAIGMIDKMNRPEHDAAKGILKQRYTPVNGCMTPIRHQLNVWNSCWKENPAYFDKTPV